MTTLQASKEYSDPAIGLATLSVLHGVIDLLVKRQLATDAEAIKLFADAAANNRLIDLPDNQEAAELLEWIVKERSVKFRSSKAA